MSSTPIIKRGYEYIHERMRIHLLKTVLPKLFPDFITRLKPYEAYPVVIGGTLVERCAKRSADASRIIADLLTEDIDIKVVLKRPIADNHDSIIPRIDAVRHDFIHKVITHLEAFAKAVSRENPEVIISVQENQKLINIPVDSVRRLRVLEVEITYIEPTKSTTLPILDLGLYTTFSVPHHYDLYQKINPAVKVPVPYVSQNKVLYATCNYAYLDTVRMLVDRAKYLEEKKTTYALMKFARYVVKFMCLYMLIEQRSIKDIDENMRQIYEHSREILQQTDLAKLNVTTDVTATDKKKELTDTPTVKQVGKMLADIIQVMHLDELVTLLTTPTAAATAHHTQIGSGGNRKTPFKTTVRNLSRLMLQRQTLR